MASLPTNCNVTPIGKRLGLKVGIGLTPGIPNQALNSQQVYGYAYAAGFTGQFADKIVAIAKAESGWNTAWYNLHSNGQCDRGLVQINDIQNNGSPGWGPCLSDACAYDPLCAMQWAFKVVGGNFNNFNAYWVTSAQGLDKKFLTNGPVGGPAIPPGKSSGASVSSSSSNTSSSSAVSSATNAITNAVQTITNAAANFKSIDAAKTAISPNADITQLLVDLDLVMLVNNPFTYGMSNIPSDSISSDSTAGIVSFTDPIAWIEQFGTNLFDDIGALFWRSILIILGTLIMIKVIGEFIDYDALMSTATQAATKLAPLLL